MPTPALLAPLPAPGGPVQFTECLPQLVTVEQPIANTTQKHPVQVRVTTPAGRKA